MYVYIYIYIYIRIHTNIYVYIPMYIGGSRSFSLKQFIHLFLVIYVSYRCRYNIFQYNII